MTDVKLDTRVLDKIAANLDGSTDRALGSIAFQVEGEAKVRAPVDTGALRNSIHTEKKKAGLYWVADGVEYGIYQELGTYKMRAQPFMVPATEAVGRDVTKMFGDFLK
jgi:HK97 gp10 family phage protein